MIETIGVRLRKARESMDLTQEELASLVGTRQQTIDKIERGITKMPRKDLLMKLSQALDVSPGWLVLDLPEIDNLDERAVQLALRWSKLSKQNKEAIENIITSMPTEEDTE